ncbi:MAG: hypothetical protein IPL95_08285 [Saprospiraceae bacterium]|nr:hypothetical protein [Saprospiraceae bacterium]
MKIEIHFGSRSTYHPSPLPEIQDLMGRLHLLEINQMMRFDIIQII